MQADETIAECAECIMPLVVSTHITQETDQDLQKCVTCPFCLQVVNAIVTPETIACPKCKVLITR